MPIDFQPDKADDKKVDFKPEAISPLACFWGAMSFPPHPAVENSPAFKAAEAVVNEDAIAMIRAQANGSLNSTTPPPGLAQDVAETTQNLPAEQQPAAILEATGPRKSGEESRIAPVQKGDRVIVPDGSKGEVAFVHPSMFLARVKLDGGGQRTERLHTLRVIELGTAQDAEPEQP